MPDTTVKYFSSTMSGAPALSNTAGTLIAVLDACLVDGFGSVTVNSLVVASNVATATVSAGHNLALVGTTGPVVRIAGATPNSLNGDWRVTSVPGSTTFTFATTGISDQTATGTITAKRAPAGFSKAFSGTNKAAYRSDNVADSRLYCRIDDGYTTNSRIRGFETMTNVDTGAGLFPTDAQINGGGDFYKATAANRAWSLFSDGQMVYLFNDAGGNNGWYGGFTFGTIDSYVAGDAYGCGLICTTVGSTVNNLYNLGSTTGSYLARSYTQLGGSLTSDRYSHKKNTNLGQSAQAYPAPADNRIHLWPVECWEGATLARGMMPGLWNPVHNSNIPNGTIITNITALPGRTLLIQIINVYYLCAIDITGPWR